MVLLNSIKNHEQMLTDGNMPKKGNWTTLAKNALELPKWFIDTLKKLWKVSALSKLQLILTNSTNS